MSNITINNKTLSINGVKTFPVFVYGGLWCYTPYDCDPENTQDYLFWAPIWVDRWPTSYDTFNEILPKFASNHIFLPAPFPRPTDTDINLLTDASINSDYFFGYFQSDEPDVWNIPVSTLVNRYNIIKSRDKNHPVMINVFRNLWTYKDTADILFWDTYTVGTLYSRSEASYWYEIISRYNALSGNKLIEDFSKPVYAVVQAYGIDTPQYSLQVLTQSEIRVMTYLPITMGVQGIGYYGWHTGDDGDAGLARDIKVADQYNAIARELHGINNILVSSTIANSWFGKWNDIAVTFNPNPTKTIDGIYLERFLNYILKRDSNNWYLILVNKDYTALSNIQIKITDLSGVTTAKLLGNQISGSGKAGRIVQVSGNTFTDSIDAQGVHIYELKSSICIPTWACETPLNGYESDGCEHRRLNSACKPVTALKYKCSGTPDYTCSEDTSGSYNSLAACQAACQDDTTARALLMLISGMIAAFFILEERDEKEIRKR